MFLKLVATIALSLGLFVPAAFAEPADEARENRANEVEEAIVLYLWPTEADEPSDPRVERDGPGGADAGGISEG